MRIDRRRKDWVFTLNVEPRIISTVGYTERNIGDKENERTNLIRDEK